MQEPSFKDDVVELRSRRVVRLGFILVMLVICFIVFFGIHRLIKVKDTLSAVISHEQVAIEMLFRMQQTARDRSVLLYSAAATPDPFERDELLLQHGQLGSKFNQAREKLTALQLDMAELTFLDSLNVHVESTRKIHSVVIDELASGNLQHAQNLLNKQAVPSQNKILGSVNTLLQYEMDKSHSTDQYLKEHQWHAQLLMVAAGFVAILFVMLIYVFINRRMAALISGLASSAQNLLKSNYSLESLKSAMDHHSIVSIADMRGDITFVNDKFCEISQYSREELVGQNHRILNSGVHSRSFFEGMWSLIAAGQIWQGEICNRSKSGGLYWVSSTIVPFLDDTGRPSRYISVRTDITAIKKAEQVLIRDKFELEKLILERTAELQKLASTDALTGIFNRRRFNEVLHSEMSRAKRYGASLTLIIFDIDYFKRINDNFGHQTGDEILQSMTALVSRSIRGADIFARWGGEEFTILMTDSEAVSTNNLAEKLRESIEAHPFAVVGKVTCSFGVTKYCAGDDLKSFIHRADANLYRAKAEGRNRVCHD